MKLTTLTLIFATATLSLNSYAQDAAPRRLLVPDQQLGNDAQRAWLAIQDNIKNDASFTADEKTQAINLLNKLNASIGRSVDQACAKAGCTLSNFVIASSQGFDAFLDGPEFKSTAFGLTDTSTDVRAGRMYLRTGFAFTLYAGLVWGTGLALGVIPESAGSAKMIASIIAGGVISNAGAFFLDTVNSKVRGLFFKIASAVQKTAGTVAPKTFARFEKIWQNAQDIMGDGRISDGRGRENSAKIATLNSLQAAITNSNTPRDRVELVALTMEQFRLTFPEIPTDTGDRANPNNAASIDKLFAAQLRSTFGNKESYFAILTELRFADDELRNKDLPAEQRSRIEAYYENLAALWLKPELWSNPEDAKLLLEEYKSRSADLIKARAEEDIAREKLLEAKRAAQVPPVKCDKLEIELFAPKGA